MKIIRGWVLPILLLCNLIVFLKDYLGTGDVNFTLLCIIFGITPIAFQDKIKFSKKNYTYFSAFMFVLAASMLILQLIKTM